MPLPPPRTEAARTALKSFYCDLCQKGYARLPEWEAHEASYDHQHKKRLKEMKAMSKDPGAAQRARKAERKADLITIKPMKLGGSGSGSGGASGASKGGEGGGGGGNTTASTTSGGGGGGGGFKRGGFKSAFGAPVKVTVEGRGESAPDAGVADAGGDAMEVDAGPTSGLSTAAAGAEYNESDASDGDEGDEQRYDPAMPTGCPPDCPGRRTLIEV